MHPFFSSIPHQQAQTVETLSRLIYELRENRNTLLGAYKMHSEAELLAAIASGVVAEHPAYEHYLSVRTLDDTRTVVRAELNHLVEAIRLATPVDEHPGGPDLPVIWPLSLAMPVEEACGEHLEGPAEVRQDALCLSIEGGVNLEARIAAPDAYSFTWTWGDALLRLDTAPVDGQSAGAAHLHTADGSRRPSPFTITGDPEAVLVQLVHALVRDPLLEQG